MNRRYCIFGTAILCFFVLTQSCIGCFGPTSYVYINKTCENGKKEVAVFNDTLRVESNRLLIISKDIDLDGNVVNIPKGVTLKSVGGVIKNGTLIGNETMISSKGALFENVEISGKWNVPYISTSLFKDLDKVNSLRHVLALANANVENQVLIEDAEYSVSANSFQAALTVASNTKLIINGNIRLVPNEHQGCYVLEVNNAENVVITGKGSLNGDKFNHKGDKGEWGHGINIIGSKNILIKNFSINDCWGDCIYVGGESCNVSIVGCMITNGRRQGLSITSGDNILVENCQIRKVYGTAPQYGIDIEPNSKDIIGKVAIEKCIIEDCYGGIYGWRPVNAMIGSVIVQNCIVRNVKCPLPIYM